MAGWVWLDHPDVPGGPERFPDDPDVVRVQEARGWKVVDPPDESAGPSVDPDEVDDRGQGWVIARHKETGGLARVPVEAFAGWVEGGWESVTTAEAAAAKKSKAGKKSESVGDDNPKE